MIRSSVKGGRMKGVTLIELAFVIGIIAVIVVGALAIFNAVRASQDRSTALQNVGARSARRSRPGPATSLLGFGTADRTAKFASQLRPWLPGRLGNGSAKYQWPWVLTAANPWEGRLRDRRPADPDDSKAVVTPASTGSTDKHPYRFKLLVITGVPDRHKPKRFADS